MQNKASSNDNSLLWHPFLNTLCVLPLYILTSFCLGYLSQQAGFRLLKAWEMAAIMQTIPLFSTIFALLLLHDTITLIQAIGGFLAVLGGIIVSLSDRKPIGKDPVSVNVIDKSGNVHLSGEHDHSDPAQCDHRR